jgi:tetratricopeptide (TPR) repeat protein
MPPAILRRTFNLRFFAALLALAALLAVGTHFLHAYQVRRNASGLLQQADRAEQEEEPVKALEYLSRYVGLAPNDLDARERFVVLYDRLALTREDQERSLYLLDDLLRRDGGRRAVRERAARTAMSLERFTDAERHLGVLLRETPDDAALLDLQGRGLEGGAKYGPAAKAYGEALEKDPGRIDTAERLAALYRDHLKDPTKADEVMDELVKANPKSAEARLARSRHRRAREDLGGAAEDVKFALENLAPESAEVLHAAGQAALETEPEASRYEAARKYFERGARQHPDDARFPMALAELELQRTPPRRREAAEYLRAALRAVPQDKADLRWVIAGLLIDAGERDEARALVEQLRLGKTLLPAGLDYLQARLKFDEEKFAEAAALLDPHRQGLADNRRELAKRINLLMARCQEQLGNPDQQLAAYDRVLQLDPRSAAASRGRAAALLALGNPEDALREFRGLLARRQSDVRVPMGRLLLLLNLRRQEDRRNWTELETLLKEAPPSVRETRDFRLLSADFLALSERLEQAEADMAKACQEHPKETLFWMERAALAERPGAGEDKKPHPERALAVLDEAERAAGDSVELRLTRAVRYAARPPEEAKAALAKLEQGADKLSPADRDRLWAGLAGLYTRQGALPEAARLLNQVAEHRPNDIGVRMLLLDIELARGDEAALDRLSKELRRLEGENGVGWRYEEVGRLVLKARKGDLSGLADARRLLAEIDRQRPKWARVPALEGEVEEQAGNVEAAIEKYQEAVKRGDRQMQLVQHTVQLLVSRRRVDDARELLRTVREQAPGDSGLARMAVEVALLDQDDAEEVLKLAERTVPKDSPNYRDHLWLGQVRAARGRKEEAEEAFRRAVELQGRAPEAWVALIAFLAETGKKEQARRELDRARRAVPADAVPGVVAFSHEALGDTAQAEEQYKDLLKSRPDDPLVQRSAASFYLRAGQTDKAIPLLKQLVAAKGPNAEANAAWARRSLALALAASGDYQKSGDALALIEENLRRRGSVPEDLRVKAIVLGVRAGGRRDAIVALEDSFLRQKPTPAEEFLLAQLYEADGDWAKARARLLGLVTGKGGTNAEYLAHYIRALLRHDETADARRWLGQLQKAEPGGPRAVELEARVLAKEGQGREAARLVAEYAHKQAAEKKNPALVVAAAALLDELGETAEAEALYREFAAGGQPDGALILARFLARHDRLGEALAQCERVGDRAPPEQVAGTMAMALRAGRSTPADVERVKAWLDAAVRRKPDSPTLLLAQADLSDVRGDYAAAEQIYRSLIARNPRNALAMNNLAWLLAVRDGKGDEAVELIDRAIDVIGPAADLLDTRASVLLVRGEYDQAVKDLEHALAQGPTGSRYFHLAQAHSRRRDRPGAQAAWRRAGELTPKLTEAMLHPLERAEFQRLQEELRRKEPEPK